MAVGRRWMPSVWALLLSLLMLGPAIAPGFALSYDMVWVPNLSLGRDALGLGSGLPRAVPSDAVIAILDNVLPGQALQKIVLVVAVAGGGAGIDRLLADVGLPARLAATTVYVWNPYVVERLVIGHWPLLLSYATLPWLALATRRLRRSERIPASVLLLLPIGSLSASAGLMSGLVLLAFAWSRSRGARQVRLLLVIAAANAPWVIAGFLHASHAVSDPDGAERFALQSDALPAPLAALGLGGIWNAEVVPATRGGPLAFVFLGLVLGLVALGWRGWIRRASGHERTALLFCWGVGWGLAVLTWLTPTGFAWLAVNLPGGGLLRDGSRLLGLCAPLLAIVMAHGVARIDEFVLARGQRLLIGVLLALSPVAFMPDAAWGVSGTLRATSYPQSWSEVRIAVSANQLVLLLPFTSYRAPDWNRGHKVLDPMGRYLSVDYVASDELVVSGEVISGEDPRGTLVRAALELPDADARASALASAGIDAVVIDRTNPEVSPEIAGKVVLTTQDHRVVQLEGARAEAIPASWIVLMGGAWAVFLGLFLIGLFRVCSRWTGAVLIHLNSGDA